MMKKLLVMAAVLMSAMTLQAEDSNVLRHLSLSAGVGTTGITADLGTMITDHVGIRAGIDYMPKIKYSTNLDLSYVNQELDDYPVPDDIDVSNVPTKVAVQGRLDNNTIHALVDIYPFKSVGFHVTVGAYFAEKDRLVSVYNKEEGSLMLISDFNARRGAFAHIPAEYGKVAAKLGDYNIMPDDNGNANAYMKVKKVRPYVGLGFGRAVPKSRIGCTFDMGVQLTGKPEVYDGVSGQLLDSDGAKGEDGGVLKTISKIQVYPVISLRLVGRLF